MLFGSEMKLPIDVLFPWHNVAAVDDYVHELQRFLQDTHKFTSSKFRAIKSK